MAGCPFCARIEAAATPAGGACAFDDGFPSAPGHRLVVPARHEADLFALPAAELGAVWAPVAEEHARLRGQGEGLVPVDLPRLRTALSADSLPG